MERKIIIFVLLLALHSISCKESKNVLNASKNNSIVDKPLVIHFTETTGFDHETRTVSEKMFNHLGRELGFDVIQANASEVFENDEVMNEVDLIVFANTTGEDLLTPNQRKKVEHFIEAGGGFIGIHAASDTHRTNWEYYNRLLGAIVQIDPWHTASDYVATMKHTDNHPLLADIPDPWTKEEEYYYWDLNGGTIDTERINVLLEVEKTGPESYDRKRPTAWYQELPSGTRSFYTSLGHMKWNYEDPTNDFRKLIRNGIVWTLADKLNQKN